MPSPKTLLLMSMMKNGAVTFVHAGDARRKLLVQRKQ